MILKKKQHQSAIWNENWNAFQKNSLLPTYFAINLKYFVSINIFKLIVLDLSSTFILYTINEIVVHPLTQAVKSFLWF